MKFSEYSSHKNWYWVPENCIRVSGTLVHVAILKKKYVDLNFMISRDEIIKLSHCNTYKYKDTDACETQVDKYE